MSFRRKVFRCKPEQLAGLYRVGLEEGNRPYPETYIPVILPERRQCFGNKMSSGIILHLQVADYVILLFIDYIKQRGNLRENILQVTQHRKDNIRFINSINHDQHKIPPGSAAEYHIPQETIIISGIVKTQLLFD